jgi:hypothetical protein
MLLLYGVQRQENLYEDFELFVDIRLLLFE